MGSLFANHFAVNGMEGSLLVVESACRARGGYSRFQKSFCTDARKIPYYSSSFLPKEIANHDFKRGEASA
jgi:hypothetical protein